MTPIAIISIIIAILVFLLIAYLGFATDILREGEGTNRMYSFRKSQLWLWTLIICPLFALYWGLGSDAELTINNSVLILLGISASSLLAGQAISDAQEKNKEARRIIPENIEEEEKFQLKQSQDSTNFWVDILMDDSKQLSIGRLQQVVFTLIYAVIFVSYFFTDKNYSFPDFDATAFALMGISTGAYVLGKGMYK